MIDPIGRLAMISGANRGIGRAVAQRLYDEGYALSLGARRPDALSTLTAAMDPARVMTRPYEALDADAAQHWVDATKKRFGRIDVLINNAGILASVSAEVGDESELDLMWDVNARGPFRMIRAAWPHLKASGSGRIVNVASLSGLRVKSPAATGYSMSKLALVALTNGIRLEGWPHGIRAAALCPGFVATDMSDGWAGVPAETMVQPDTIARMTAFLIALPNEASVASWAVNCQPEPGW